MKRKFFIVTIILLSFGLFAQEVTESDSLDFVENLANDDSAELLAVSSDDFTEDYEDAFSDDLDEWADLFEDAQDVDSIVVTEEKQTVVTKFLGSSNITLSGHFDGDIGLAMTESDFKEIQDHASGALSGFFLPLSGYFVMDNYLYFLAKPSDSFQLRASVYSAVSNRFTISLETLYCNYIPFDRLYISAGKKSIAWGYTRIFNDTDIYNGSIFTGPALTNVMSDSGGYFLGEARFPWNKGTVTGVVLANYNNTSPGIAQLGYALSSEMSIPHFTWNIFGRTYGVQETFTAYDVNGEARSAQRNPLAGIEGKASFSGYDFYAQGICNIKKKVNYDYDLNLCDGSYVVPGIESAVFTVGGYKLWDAQDPNFGLNVEYQFRWLPSFGHSDYQNRIAVQAGIKRMGKRKNLKTAADWYHNFNTNYGQASVSFIMASIFNYAQWSNKVLVQYGPDLAIPKVNIGTAIQVDVDY